MNLDELLGRMNELNAADLFLKVPLPPTYKISGRAVPSDYPLVSRRDGRAGAEHPPAGGPAEVPGR